MNVATLIEDAVRSAALMDLSEVEVDLIANRANLLARWCAIYRDLESTMDPGYDENRLPVTGYLGEDSANERNAYAEWFHAQSRLRLVEQRANESLGRFLRRFYTGSPPDQEEFERVLKSSLLPQNRVECFRRMR